MSKPGQPTGAGISDEERGGYRHLALDWLQYGNEWDELRAQCALRYLSELRAAESRYAEQIKDLEFQVEQLSKKEIQKASCCSENERRLALATDELERMKAAIEKAL